MTDISLIPYLQSTVVVLNMYYASRDHIVLWFYMTGSKVTVRL